MIRHPGPSLKRPFFRLQGQQHYTPSLSEDHSEIRDLPWWVQLTAGNARVIQLLDLTTRFRFACIAKFSVRSRFRDWRSLRNIARSGLRNPIFVASDRHLNIPALTIG